MTRVAIVGLGHVAVHQIAAISTLADFKLVAGCDTDPETFHLLDPSVSSYSSIENMLEREDLDVVVVASPNRFHVTHGITVLASGRWLVMEKPLAESRIDFDYFAEKHAQYDGRCYLSLHAAFAPEMKWLFDEANQNRFDFENLVSINARFYDPYFEDGTVLDHALSLGGSWLDSGINALSVVCRFIAPDNLTISDSRMTRVSGSRCAEVQGTVDFDFARTGTTGRVSIDTNWTLGRDSKSTVLRFSDRYERLKLDHSAQQVLILSDSDERVLFKPANTLPRLTNHYIGVFSNLLSALKEDEDNFEYCCRLHDLFFDAQATR